MPDNDYVLIARGETLVRPWPDLRQDLTTCLKRLKAWRAAAASSGVLTGMASAMTISPRGMAAARLVTVYSGPWLRFGQQLPFRTKLFQLRPGSAI